ncbi:MAG: sulfate adenylyltransferase subunit CysD [SAR86 cluster bacterium]|uniref:Sulfate adenylyltransferase subunit 2 n=1 Tax=SAR86 cluster bacterium TaxID=2030880 RepID=A0A2A5B722_9GAMM|nr:MAG: sulfate adenylyltransferase subunit CysD [SAR86 cluster bacterium]
MDLPSLIYKNQYSKTGEWLPWSTQSVHNALNPDNANTATRTTERAIESSGLIPNSVKLEDITDENQRAPKLKVLKSLESEAKRKRYVSMILQEYINGSNLRVLFVNDGRGGRRWVYLESDDDEQELLNALNVLSANKNILLWPHGPVTSKLRALLGRSGNPEIELASGKTLRLALPAYQDANDKFDWDATPASSISKHQLSNLDRLEANSIHILREVVAQAENPAMLFSLGKDSCVMLHLAMKAFYPSPPPFPLMHVDTRWKFQAMYRFRDEIVRTSGMDMIIHTNPEAISKNINPFDHGSELHTHVTKTEGLIQALDKYQIDVALGGARRDEEKSRAKERVFSIRTSTHRWDPKKQRPELWNLYNGYKEKKESIRAFPLSDWTELDIWQYIYKEKIPIIPLYFASYRPVVERDGILMLVDDDRLELFEGEQVQIKKVRFRTLGCYPLTGALESDADDLPSIILELLQSNNSEREGRVIDKDSSASMEKKKQEGYF